MKLLKRLFHIHKWVDSKSNDPYWSIAVCSECGKEKHWIA